MKFADLLKPKEKQMTKKTVISFKRGDAPKPTKSPNGNGILLRAPFPITLKPQASVRVDFGLESSAPLLLWHTFATADQLVYEANKPIVVKITNPSLTEDLIYEYGQPMLTVIPVLPSEFELE